jgi:hypothetical protein
VKAFRDVFSVAGTEFDALKLKSSLLQLKKVRRSKFISLVKDGLEEGCTQGRTCLFDVHTSTYELLQPLQLLNIDIA